MSSSRSSSASIQFHAAISRDASRAPTPSPSEARNEKIAVRQQSGERFVNMSRSNSMSMPSLIDAEKAQPPARISQRAVSRSASRASSASGESSSPVVFVPQDRFNSSTSSTAALLQQQSSPSSAPKKQPPPLPPTAIPNSKHVGGSAAVGMPPKVPPPRNATVPGQSSNGPATTAPPPPTSRPSPTAAASSVVPPPPLRVPPPKVPLTTQASPTGTTRPPLIVPPSPKLMQPAAAPASPPSPPASSNEASFVIPGYHYPLPPTPKGDGGDAVKHSTTTTAVSPPSIVTKRKLVMRRRSTSSGATTSVVSGSASPKELQTLGTPNEKAEGQSASNSAVFAAVREVGQTSGVEQAVPSPSPSRGEGGGSTMSNSSPSAPRLVQSDVVARSTSRGPSAANSGSKASSPSMVPVPISDSNVNSAAFTLQQPTTAKPSSSAEGSMDVKHIIGKAATARSSESRSDDASRSQSNRVAARQSTATSSSSRQSSASPVFNVVSQGSVPSQSQPQPQQGRSSASSVGSTLFASEAVIPNKPASAASNNVTGKQQQQHSRNPSVILINSSTDSSVSSEELSPFRIEKVEEGRQPQGEVASKMAGPISSRQQQQQQHPSTTSRNILSSFVSHVVQNAAKPQTEGMKGGQPAAPPIYVPTAIPHQNINTSASEAEEERRREKDERMKARSKSRGKSLDAPPVAILPLQIPASPSSRSQKADGDRSHMSSSQPRANSRGATPTEGIRSPPLQNPPLFSNLANDSTLLVVSPESVRSGHTVSSAVPPFLADTSSHSVRGGVHQPPPPPSRVLSPSDAKGRGAAVHSPWEQLSVLTETDTSNFHAGEQGRANASMLSPQPCGLSPSSVLSPPPLVNSAAARHSPHTTRREGSTVEEVEEALVEAEDQKELLRLQLRAAGDHLAQLTRMYNMLNEHNDGIEAEYTRIRLVVDTLSRGVTQSLREEVAALKLEQQQARERTVSQLATFYRDVQNMMLKVMVAANACNKDTSEKGSIGQLRSNGGGGASAAAEGLPSVQPLRVSAPPTRSPSRASVAAANPPPNTQAHHHHSASEDNSDDENDNDATRASERSRTQTSPSLSFHQQPSRSPPPLTVVVPSKKEVSASPPHAAQRHQHEHEQLQAHIDAVARELAEKLITAKTDKLKAKRKVLKRTVQQLEEELRASTAEAALLKEQLRSRDNDFAVYLRDVKHSYNEQLLTCEIHIKALMQYFNETDFGSTAEGGVYNPLTAFVPPPPSRPPPPSFTAVPDAGPLPSKPAPLPPSVPMNIDQSTTATSAGTSVIFLDHSITNSNSVINSEVYQKHYSSAAMRHATVQLLNSIADVRQRMAMRSNVPPHAVLDRSDEDAAMAHQRAVLQRKRMHGNAEGHRLHSHHDHHHRNSSNTQQGAYYDDGFGKRRAPSTSPSLAATDTSRVSMGGVPHSSAAMATRTHSRQKGGGGGGGGGNTFTVSNTRTNITTASPIVMNTFGGLQRPSQSGGPRPTAQHQGEWAEQMLIAHKQKVPRVVLAERNVNTVQTTPHTNRRQHHHYASSSVLSGARESNAYESGNENDLAMDINQSSLGIVYEKKKKEKRRSSANGAGVRGATRRSMSEAKGSAAGVGYGGGSSEVGDAHYYSDDDTYVYHETTRASRDDGSNRSPQREGEYGGRSTTRGGSEGEGVEKGQQLFVNQYADPYHYYAVVSEKKNAADADNTVEEEQSARRRERRRLLKMKEEERQYEQKMRLRRMRQKHVVGLNRNYDRGGGMYDEDTTNTSSDDASAYSDSEEGDSPTFNHHAGTAASPPRHRSSAVATASTPQRKPIPVDVSSDVDGGGGAFAHQQHQQQGVSSAVMPKPSVSPQARAPPLSAQPPNGVGVMPSLTASNLQTIPFVISAAGGANGGEGGGGAEGSFVFIPKGYSISAIPQHRSMSPSSVSPPLASHQKPLRGGSGHKEDDGGARHHRVTAPSKERPTTMRSSSANSKAPKPRGGSVASVEGGGGIHNELRVETEAIQKANE